MREFSNFYLPTQYFNDVCRICLSKHDVLIPIEEVNLTHNLRPNGYIENVNLKTVFQKFCNVEVEASDNKPQRICEFCITTGCKAFNFFQLFLYSNALLDKKLEDNKLSPDQLNPNEGDTNNACRIPNVCSDDVISLKNKTVMSVSQINSEDASDDVIEINEASMGSTDTQKKKQSRVRLRPQRPQPWLEPNGDIDPSKEGALRLLLKMTNKTLPKVQAEKPTPEYKPRASQIRQIEHQNDIFKCKFCKKVFHDITKVIKHLKEEHAESKRCVFCPIRFKKTSSLVYHVAAHSPKALVCRTCRLYFENKEALDRHKEIVDHTNTKRCPTCQKTFRKPSDVRFHMDTVHFKKQNYQCKLCGKLFRYVANMRRHEQNAHGNRKFLCQVCGKGFSTLYQLKVHMQRLHKINQGIILRKYTAKKRGWVSRDPRAPKEVKFYCEYCPKKFYNSHAFLIHCEIHPEFKEYRCDVCDEVLETRKNYVRHYRAHEIYKCPFPSCVRMFPSERTALLHKYAHKKPFRCTVCNRRFRIKHSLDVHMNVHTGERPYTCEKCGQGFKQRQHLDVHRVSIHGGIKRWQCKLCDKAFSYSCGLRCHMRSHRGEKPFPCPFCDKMFRDTTGRHKHVKRDHPQQLTEFLTYKEKYQDQEILRIERESEKNRTDTESNSDDSTEQ